MKLMMIDSGRTKKIDEESARSNLFHCHSSEGRNPGKD
jgi:hypothetical protein